MIEETNTSIITAQTEIDSTIMAGDMYTSIIKNNKQIKTDRAQAIIEDTEMIYKRLVQDLQRDLTRAGRSRQAELDLSPSDSTSLTLAKNFVADDFVTKDMEFSMRIRDLSIKLSIAKERYKQLFGKEL